VSDRPGPSVPGKRVGISDVAARAGVSPTTVSHVLSGRRPVSEATRARVRAVMDELGWEPNQVAQSLRMRRTHTIALIVPDITNPFYPSVARGLLDVVSEPGYQVLIGNTDGDPEAERALVAQMVTRSVDGIVFAGYYSKATDVEAAVEAGIPVALMGGRKAEPGIDVLSSDDLAAGEIATRYLVDRGYRRIGFITGASGDGPPADRVKGYRRALSSAGIGFSRLLVVRGEFSRSFGAEGLRSLFDLKEPPDAVLCTNDVVAIGALDAVREKGLRVPEDIAVMGFDDIEAAALISPSLTTISGDPRGQGVNGSVEVRAGEQSREFGRLVEHLLAGALRFDQARTAEQLEVLADRARRHLQLTGQVGRGPRMREQREDVGSRRTDQLGQVLARRRFDDRPQCRLAAWGIAEQGLGSDVERDDRVRAEQCRLENQAASVDALGPARVADPVDLEEAVLVADRGAESVEHRAGAVLGEHVTAIADVRGEDRPHPVPVRRDRRTPVFGQGIEDLGHAVGAGELVGEFLVDGDQLSLEGWAVDGGDDREFVLELCEW